MTWIFFTLFAAFMQAWRNAFQKQLSGSVDSFGTTFARFAFAVPLAVLYLVFLYSQSSTENFSQNPPLFTSFYWLYVGIAAISQILATVLMVLLFQQRNYAIGIGLAKSEAILAAIIGVGIFHDHLSLWGWIGVLIGGVAVFLLSSSNKRAELSFKTLAIGIASGLCFAITSILTRQASLELPDLPYLYRAAWVLCSIISLQWIGMMLYALCFHRAVLVAMWRKVGLVLRVSLCSFCGSLGWFTAMSMQSVGVVKTLGQIEVLFSLLISLYFFREKLNRSSYWGLLLVVIAAILVIWA